MPTTPARAERKPHAHRQAAPCLDEEQFVLHYQPVHELAGGALRGVEALVRWQDPAGGLVPPAGFLPHAEETGMIARIGEWVLETTLSQAVEWEALGLLPRVAVNASPRELCDERYVDRVADALARHGLAPDRLLIEVSESAMHEFDRAHDVIERLHELGVVLALDDFGTAHSSLSRLRDMPVQVLKVDRSFLRGAPGDVAGAAIVRAIATLGAGLGMDVVAEGIETEEQRSFARAAGCGLGQGYLFARPLPAAQVTPLLHLLRRRHAEQAERTRDHALRRDAEREPERLQRLRLGADDVAVAIEGGERLRGLERVDRDPVRRAALRRLGHLGRERQQLLHQLALGGLERQALATARRARPRRAPRRPSPARTRSARARTGRSRRGSPPTARARA